MEPSLAHWRSGTKVGQGGERPGRPDSLCPPHRASSAICEQCVKRKTQHSISLSARRHLPSSAA